MPSSKKSYIEFAADIKKKYPAYKNIDDLQLAKDIVAKYPAYSEIVSFEKEKFDTSDLSLRNTRVDLTGSKLNQQPLTIQPLVGGGGKQNYFDNTQPKGINKTIQANQQQYLANPQHQAVAQFDNIQAQPAKYVTPNAPDENGNPSAYDLSEDKEYMDNLFAAMPAQKQFQEWQKNKERWNGHEAVQPFKTVDDDQKGLSKTAPVNWVEAISAGADAVMGGLSEFMYQNIEKPLYGWMWKDPNSRQIWGRLSDHFHAGQQYLSSAAGKENTVDNNGQIRQKDFVDYFKEGDWWSAMDDITTGALESLPTSAVAIGATMAGSPQAGLALIGAQVAGSRKRELDRYNPELSEWQKNLIAYGSGAIEAGSELLGDVPIGKMLSNLYKRGGTVVFDNVMKNSVDDIIKTTTKNLRNGSLLWKAPLGEGSEEVVSGVGNYLLDTAVGIQNFNWSDMMTDAAKQGVYGAVSGGGFGLMGARGIAHNQKVAKALETLKSDYDQKKSELDQSLNGSGLEFNGEKIITLPLDQQEQVLRSVLSAENLTDKQKASIAGYMEAGNRLNTALVNTGLTNIELLRKKAAAVKEISERVNDKTGTIDAVTIQGTADSEVYELKSGHLETDEEGNINTRKSDESVYYYTGNTNEDGTREVNIIPSLHISKIEQQSPQAVLTQKFTEIEQEEFGRSEFGEGMIVRLTDEQGNTPQLDDGSPLTGVINAVTENGFVVEMPDGSESEIPFRVAAQTMENVEVTQTAENTETEEQATPAEYQPGATATINGTTYIVRDKDEQGNYNITDADGNLIDRFTPREMADMGFQVTLPNNPDAEYPIQEVDVAVPPKMTPEQQAEAEQQNFIATLPRISQGKKAGRVDTKKLTPEQAFRYTQIMEGTETAVKDIKEDIFAIDSSIRELNKKLQTTKGNAKIDIREDIRELNEQRSALKTILDREMPGLEAALKAEADKRAQIESEVQAKNQALEEERKNRVLTDEERKNLHNNVVSLIKEHNEIPPSHTQKRRAIFNEINKKSSQLGYSVNVMPGGQFSVQDKEGKTIRTIAQRTPQEEIDAHPSLTDYAPEFQAFVQQLIQCMPETLDIPNTNIVVGVKDVQEGKKSIAANRLLDEIEKMFISGEIIIRATASTPEVVLSIDEYFQLFEPATEPEQQVLDTAPDEILNELLGDGLMTDEISNYINDLYNETYNQINGRAEAESPAAGIIRNAEEGVSGEKGTADQQQGEVSTPINYKNGDTVTYKGKQYTVSAFGKDEAGNAVYDLELNGKTMFEDVMESELGGEINNTTTEDLEKYVIGERELMDIIKRSPTPEFEDFQNEAVGAYTHLIEPNETITGIELAKRIAKAYDLYNQRNRIDFSAIWYMGNKEIKHTLNGVSVKGKHKGNVSVPEIKQEQPTPQKQPWEMTREEIGKSYSQELKNIDEKFGRTISINSKTKQDIFKKLQDELDNHKAIVQRAISEGKQVPDEVLIDYPELIKVEDETLTGGQKGTKANNEIAEAPYNPENKNDKQTTPKELIQQVLDNYENAVDMTMSDVIDEIAGIAYENDIKPILDAYETYKDEKADDAKNWGERGDREAVEDNFMQVVNDYLNQSEQPTEKQSSGNKLPEQDLSVLNDAKTQLDNALKTINAKDLDKAKVGVGISAMYFARKFVKTPDTNKPLYDAIYNYYFDTVSNYQLPEQAEVNNEIPVSEDGLYQIREVKVKKNDGSIVTMFAVPTANSKGLGDKFNDLFDTIEEAIQGAKENRAEQQRDEERDRQYEEEKRLAAEAKAAKAKANEGKTPAQIMQEAREKSIIDKWGKEVERRLADGYEFKVVDEVDKAAEKKREDHIAYLNKVAPWGNEKHPQTIELNQLKADVKAGKRLTKKSYRLDKNGVFIEVPKTVLDYYTSKTPEQTKPKETVKEEELGTPKSIEDMANEAIEKDAGYKQIADVATKYGWTTETDGANVKLINGKGKHVATVIPKGGSYVINDTEGTKLMSGGRFVSNGVEKVIKEYFYGKEVDPQKPAEKPAPKNENPKITKLQEEADDALKDFLDAFNDLNSDNLGIVDNSAEKQAKMLVAGTKMVGAYTKLGVYKFADLISKLAEKGIQITEDLLSAIKKAYGAFAAESDIDELDDMKTVRKFTLNDLSENKPEDLTPKEDNSPKNVVSLSSKEIYIESIKSKLANGEKIKNTPELVKMAQEAGYDINNIKNLYDIASMSLNQYIYDNKENFNPEGKTAEEALQIVARLNELSNLLPTETQRSATQVELQQYSTPPAFAFLVNWAAGVNSKDHVLEPSAGEGNIAIFAKNTGAKVYVNEWDADRRDLLSQIGFDVVTKLDAKLIHVSSALKDKAVTTVVMNPPFSKDVAMGGKMDLHAAEKHIEGALQKLVDEGRLVAIVGRGMSFDSPTHKAWWDKIKKQYHVRANVLVSGDAYTKKGTSFDNRILVIDKTGETFQNEQILTGEAKSYEELTNLLTQLPQKPRLSYSKYDGNSIRNSKDENGKSGGDSQPSLFDAPSANADGVQPGNNGQSDNVNGDKGRYGAGNIAPDGLQRPGSSKSSGSKPAGQGISDTANKPGTNRGRAKADIDSGTPANKNEGKLGLDDNANQKVEPLKVTRNKKTEVSITGGYADYVPEITIEGSKPHPTKLVESTAMSSVSLPSTNYSPTLPISTIESGAISSAQIEDVILAGNAHRQILPNGERRGFFLGAGTGYGKGRTIAAIIFDNWNKGKKKAVWVSKNEKAHYDSPDYWKAVGGDPSKLFSQKNSKNKINQSEGVLMMTYDTLKSSFDANANNSENPKFWKEQHTNRMQQIAQWLGKDFDGVIIFDESHEMANGIAQKGTRGVKKASLKALAGIEFQRLLPKAKIVYSSATGATEVSNFTYAQRLGLWGDGTPFNGAAGFISAVESSGVAGMEIIAKDLKAMGVYTAKALSFDGVVHRSLEHKIFPEQKVLYDKLARAWQLIYKNIEDAIEINNTSSQAKSAAKSAFWGGQQRFFSQIIMTMEMPTVIQDIQRKLDDGNAVVIQLVNTNEAQQNRALAEAKAEAEEGAEIDYETLDMSPKSGMLQMLLRSFPVGLFTERTDENGNIIKVPVMDEEGHQVQNPEAVRMRDRLIEELDRDLTLPESPLDMLLNTFGIDNVAEITGRSKRVVQVMNENGEFVKREEKRTPSHALQDKDDFMEGKKNILVFSDAGGTGASFHADLSKKNQKQRSHYLLQAGWRADKAVQGLGRSHRANQRVAPEIILPSTDLKSQKRFISSIARRLEQLGALTKGQRDTANQGMFGEMDNLEGEYAKQALFEFYIDVENGRVRGVDMDTLERQMVIQIYKEENGVRKYNTDVCTNTKLFLNHIMSLEVDLMDKVFNGFIERLEEQINTAKENGSYDEGIQQVHALHIKVADETEIYTDEKTGAKTFLTNMELEIPNTKTDYESLLISVEHYGDKFKGFYREKNSGKIYGIVSLNGMNADGSSYQTVKRISVVTSSIVEPADFRGKYEKVPAGEAELLWNKEYKEYPNTRKKTETIVKGLILPIWNRLPDKISVKRYVDDNGKAHLGRYFFGRDVRSIIENFGVSSGTYTTEDVKKILNDGGTIKLSNGFVLTKTKYQSLSVIQIGGTVSAYRDRDRLERAGVMFNVKSSMAMTGDFYINMADAETVLPEIIRLYNSPVVAAEDSNGNPVMANKNNIQFQAVSPIGFYSTIEKALEAIQQERGTKDQFKAMLLKNGAKQAEMDWMGFDELPEKLTKADIQNWIDENRIEVQEVEKGTSKTFGREQAIKYLDKGYEIYGIDDSGIEFLIEDSSDIDRTDRFTTEEGLAKEETKFSRYTLPGGENYKEFLLTMPVRNKIKDYIKQLSKKYNVKLPNDFSDNRTSDMSDELYDELSEEEISKFDSLSEKDTESFESSHYSEPNILAHVRFNERIIPATGAIQFDIDYDNWVKNGKKGEKPDFKKYGNDERVLFIEEFQSDWAQEGKKKGFANTGDNSNVKEARKAYEEAKTREDEVNNKLIDVISEAQKLGLPAGASSSEWDMFTYGLFKTTEVYRIENKMSEVRNNKEWNEYQSMLDEITSKQNALGKQRLELIKERSYLESLTNDRKEKLDREIRNQEYYSVPDMPFKKTDQWLNLAARRMMRYAAENGFDRIAWTTGEQQAERYDLSKHLNSIDWGKNYDGTYDVQGNLIKGGYYTKKKLDANGIAEHFGKEIADKITSSTEEEGLIEGVDLKIGGEGMKAFYDAIVPSVMSKLGKPFGAKVESIDISSKNFTESNTKVYRTDQGNYQLLDNDGNIISSMTGETAQGFTPEDLHYELLHMAKKYSKVTTKDTVQSIPVTDSMKETAMAGLPLYHTGTTMKPTTPEEVAATVEQLLKTGLAKEVRMVTPEEIGGILDGAETLLRTPTGTIYGFVKNGIVYINSSTLNLNTPIHEFGHLWIDAIEGTELYNRGAELVKETPYWERVNTDPNYKDLSETARIKEAMAMAIGDKGEAVKRDLGLFARIKTWINDVWKRIGAKFGIQNLTPEQIQNLTFTDFVEVAVSELFSGENLAENELSNPFRRLDKAYEAKEYEQKQEISIREALADNDIPKPDDVWKDANTIFKPKRIVFNEDNIAVSLYQQGAKGIRDVHKQYQSLLNLKGSEYGYPYVDTSSAMYFRDLINPEIDNYVAMLQQVKHLSTPAAQEIINELIEDARQSKDYYNRLAAGEDVWRTEKSPRYQIVGEEVAENVVNSKKEANFESQSNGLDDIRQCAERFDSAADENKKYEAALELAEALNTTFGKTYDEYAYAVVRTAEDMRSILDRDFGNTLNEKEKQNTCTGLGAYFNNRTYFIAENIDNSNNFIRTWAHENAHRETEHNFSEDFLASIYEAFEASEQGIVDKLLPSRYADLSTAEKVDEMLSFTIEEMFTQAAMQGHSLTSKQIDRMTSMGNIDFKGALSTIYNNIINVQNNERPGKDRNDRRLHISEGRNEGKPDTRAIQGNRDPGRAYRRDSEEQEGSGRGIHAIGDHQRGDGRADIVPEFTGDIAAYSGETNRRNLTVRSRLSDENLSSNLRNARRQLFNAGWELDQARKAKEAGTMSDSTFEKKQAELTSVITRLKKEMEGYEQQMQQTVVEPTPEDIDIDDPKPTRTPGQSIAEYATALADWNYRQTLARALAATTKEVTGGLPAAVAPENNEIEMDLLRLELDQRLGGFFGRLAEGWQDNIRSVRIFLDLLRDKGTRVSDFNDFYMQYTAIQGKNDAHLKDFGKRFMETINANLKNIQKFTNYTYREIENYVFLKHGIERNEYMREAAKAAAESEGKKFRERDDYSGIYAIAAELWAKQNGVAFNPRKKGEVEKIQADPEFVKERDNVIAEYVEKFEKTINEAGIPGAVKGETLTIDGFWEAINASTNYSLDKLVASGIEDKNEIDDLKSRYQYYVPLRGHEVEAEKVWQYEAPDNKNVVSKAIMQASGRATRAEHPFAYIIQMAQTSINKANRNTLNQTLLRLGRMDKSGLMSVSEAWYVLTGTDPESGKEIWTETEPEFSEDHEIRPGEITAWNEKMSKLEAEGKARRSRKGLNIGGLFIKPKQRRQHAISVYEGGVLYQVYINGNPRVSQAVNELNNRTLDNYSIVKVIRSTTRFISSMITSRSPQFMLTNGARDLAFASTILPSKEGAKYTGTFLKNYPIAMGVLANDATLDLGADSARYKKYLREFEMNGGETGYSHLLELQDIEKKLRKDHKGKNYLNPITDVETLVEVIDAGNKVIENSTRFAVYITSRESGRSIERSVSDSKEVTLNFNRRGSGIMGAAEIQSLFMFVNAGVQALANFGRVYKMHPVKMSATIGAYAAVGFMLPMIIAMIGGDDDEKEYMNMTDWERQTNLCLPTGDGFAKIPLPQEMRVFFKLGDEVYKLYTGRTEAVETAMATLMSAADMIPISPLGTIAAGEVNDFGDLQRAISPDALRGVAELATNKNFMGGQIVDKYKAEKEGLPGYQKARLNRVGDPRAPESIYGFTRWLDKLTGGDGVQKGKISLNPDIVNHLAKSYLGGMYSLAAEGEKSFTRRFYTSNADIEEKNTTVKDYYKRTDEADEFIRKAKGYAAQLASGEISEQEYNKKVSDKALERASTIHSYDKVITKIERLLKTGELSADDERYYKNMSDSLKREVIRIQ